MGREEWIYPGMVSILYNKLGTTGQGVRAGNSDIFAVITATLQFVVKG
jgi:hypothetical protein